MGIDAQVLCWKLLCWSSRRKSYCIINNCLVLLAWSGARIFFLGRLPLNDDIQCLRRASLNGKVEPSNLDHSAQNNFMSMEQLLQSSTNASILYPVACQLTSRLLVKSDWYPGEVVDL